LTLTRVDSSDGHLRPILPRSRHRPLASTEGSLIEKVNKTGVRLWTGCSFNESRAASAGKKPLPEGALAQQRESSELRVSKMMS
jgi:hypothetical protein